ARLWEVATGRQRHTLLAHEGSVAHAAFAPEGEELATASGEPGNWDYAVGLWDVTGGQERRALAGHTAAVTGLTFISGKELASRRSSPRCTATAGSRCCATWRRRCGTRPARTAAACGPSAPTGPDWPSRVRRPTPASTCGTLRPAGCCGRSTGRMGRSRRWR